MSSSHSNAATQSNPPKDRASSPARAPAPGVARQSSPHDRRLVLVELTEVGRAILEQAREARRKRLCESLARMGKEGRREFMRLLRVYLVAAEAGEQSV